MKLLIFYLVTVIAIEVGAQQAQPSPCSIAVYWVDRRCPELRHPDARVDTLFDRVVGLVLARTHVDGRHVAIGSGVYITRKLILTSNNAYRRLSERPDTMNRLRVYIVIGRRFNSTGWLLYYNIQIFNSTKIECARQVIPPDKNTIIPDHMRHGIHCPLHDLMVMRITRLETFLDPMPPRRFSFPDYMSNGDWIPEDKNWRLRMGPIQTKIARPGDEIADDVRWASMGHIDDEHIRLYRFLELGKISIGEKVITNCDAWFPREWGHFICLFNKHKYPGLASGGVLFSDDKLFGIGSFALFKGAHSVLVFTDVRPYWHLLYRTCTYSDQELKVPRNP